MAGDWGWRTVNDAAEDDAALVIAAASLELLHACALIHDDVMDASATRRGRPSAHHAFAELHRTSGWTGDPDVFGTAAAILLGDLLLSWADALFASAGLPESVRPEVRHVWDDMRELVMAGQYLDVLVQARGEFSAEDALRVAKFKTSKYTVEGPLHLGAAAAGAGRDVFAALTAYGVPLGEAFQLRDDVLGVFGDPEVTGKPAGDDLREGKRTLLIALTMQRASAAVSARQFPLALELFDKIVLLRPTWAEAWNKRATVRFLGDDMDGAMEDIEQVLKLEPRHFGALTGMGFIMQKEGLDKGALAAFRKEKFPIVPS